MDGKDPTSYSLITYIWVTGLAVGGGLVSYMHKLQIGVRSPFSLIEFFGELITAGFTGLITFWLCESTGISPLLTAVFVGISGHMGSRALYVIEKIMESRFKGL
jgi:hypothetical protein